MRTRELPGYEMTALDLLVHLTDSDPEHARQMVRAVAEQTAGALPCTCKIRLDERHPDLRRTVELVRQLEAAGVHMLTVHGRTHRMRAKDPVDYDAIRLVRESVSRAGPGPPGWLSALIVFLCKSVFYGAFVWARRALNSQKRRFPARAVPVIANGDAFTYADVEAITARTGCDGVMAARGLLANPAMFDARGFKHTPPACVAQYLPGLLTQGVLGVPQKPLAPRQGPLGPSPDRGSAIGHAPALVPGPLARP